MDEKSKAEVNQHYSRLLKKHGPSLDALGDICSDLQTPLMRSTEQLKGISLKRFSGLTNIEPIARDSSVLDVGCGLGHLCDFMRDAGWQGKYTGLDINPDMVAAAKQRLPREEFICKDILTEEFHQQSDYVFCGATIQHRPKFSDPEEYLHEMIRKMFSLSIRGLAFDVFSNRVDYVHEDKLYTDPASLLNYCYGLTTRLTFRNDHRPYELIVYLYVDGSKDELNVYSSWVTPEFKIV